MVAILSEPEALDQFNDQSPLLAYTWQVLRTKRNFPHLKPQKFGYCLKLQYNLI